MLLLCGCYKDELDLESLNNNPFDRDYQGPSLFEIASTSLEQVPTIIFQGNPPQPSEILLTQHVMVIGVREDLFLSSPSYFVYAKEEGRPSVLLAPTPPGSNTFKYYREPAPGQTVCLELRLSNNHAHARAETLCANL